MNPRIQLLIDSLKLQPHPEGGYYGEFFRSSHSVGADQDRPRRLALTSIHFLLVTGQCSRWHRVLSDEVWSHLEGQPLELSCFDTESGQLRTILLGTYDSGTQPVFVVPAGCWQAAQPLGEYTLVGCTVGPGFEFVDFSLAADLPDVARAIRALGKSSEKLL